MSENTPQAHQLPAPRRQAMKGDILPVEISGFVRSAQALDHPEHARPDLALLEGGLAAIEVADRQQTIRCGE